MADSKAAYEAMRGALRDLLDGLTREQYTRACLPFGDEALRTSWAYFPREEPGIAIGELNHRQQKLVHRLLQTGLSAESYARANVIMSLENVLDELEGRRATAIRDSGLYHLVIWVDTAVRPLGNSLGLPRGWRFEGHHISVNYTFADRDLAASSPLFLGANRARITHNGYDLIRPLGDAEDRARELLAALAPEQRARAVVHAEAPRDMVLANSPLVVNGAPALEMEFVRAALEASGTGHDVFDVLAYNSSRPVGIASEDMSSGQRELLAKLVQVYADRYPAGAAWDGLDSLDELHFAWAGSDRVGEGHYYRLQGPNLVVEYDNTQDNANHVHTVCRHPQNDFGAKALALHYAAAH